MAKISDLIKYLEDIKKSKGDLEILRDITYLDRDYDLFGFEDLEGLCYIESCKKMENGFYDFEHHYEDPDSEDFNEYLIM